MTRPLAYDLIVFDWDGTLFDSTTLIARCLQAACADVGTAVPSEQAAKYVIGLGLADALRHAAPELPPARYRELGERYRQHYLARHHEIVLFDGTLDMLRDLGQRGHRLGVATGKTRSGLDEALTSSLLQGVFDATRTADETASKPHPRMLLELMQELGAEPDRTLMIGDTTHDLQLARNAGVEGIGVSFGAHEHASFADFPTLHIAHTTADLHAWLVAHG